ncbi:MAG TPA: hypothetical protein VMN60_13995, partial [Longimicrobiales bacterium]|nr:hypothetical protein [Longimicrobiales bacterium]
MRRHWLSCTLAFLLLPAALAAQQIDSLTIRAHTRFLADDLLAGRGTGSAGERIAAAYIGSQLERLGLHPFACPPAAACPDSARTFLLPIPLRSAHIDAASTLTITSGRDSTRFVNGRDFIVNTGGHGAFRDFRGRALFFGQPVHAAPLLARTSSLAGRVAVFLGPLGGDALVLVPALRRAGVAGILLLVTDPAQYDLYVRSRGAVRFFVDAPVNDPVWQSDMPVIIAGPHFTRQLFAGVDVPDALLEGTAAAPLDLAHTIDARIRTTTAAVPAANVGAVLTGSDPARRGEWIIFTAHYDHLGVGSPDADGDSIYNGF